MEDDGNIVQSLFIVAIYAIAIIFLVFALGTIIDNFLFQYMQLGADINMQFMESLNNMTTLFDMFFWMPRLFLALITIWLFKSIIFKHRYTRRGETDYPQFDNDGDEFE